MAAGAVMAAAMVVAAMVAADMDIAVRAMAVWGYGGYGYGDYGGGYAGNSVVAAARGPYRLGVLTKEAARPYADSSRAKPRINSMQAASSPISTNSSGWWASSMRPGPHNTVGTPARWNCPASEA